MIYFGMFYFLVCIYLERNDLVISICLHNLYLTIVIFVNILNPHYHCAQVISSLESIQFF